MDKLDAAWSRTAGGAWAASTNVRHAPGDTITVRRRDGTTTRHVVVAEVDGTGPHKYRYTVRPVHARGYLDRFGRTPRRGGRRSYLDKRRYAEWFGRWPTS